MRIVRASHLSSAVATATVAGVLFASVFLGPAVAQRKKLARPKQLDEDVQWRRDPATGVLSTGRSLSSASNSTASASGGAPLASPTIRVHVNLVPVTCSVLAEDGTPLRGLARGDFHLYDNGVEQKITYFDASQATASISLLVDVSPSVFRESAEMKQAARAFARNISPADEISVVDFSAHSYLLLPFSRDRGLLDEAIDRIDVRNMASDVGGTNIYEAVYLAARQLFANRTGRKAIVLLTDGQDSGLGLTLDPSTASPRRGQPGDRLTFDDVATALAESDVQAFVITTQSRPKRMTPDWLAGRANRSLVAQDAREWGIPAYTLYLAELVRRSGGQLYFLREAETLAESYRRIAASIGGEYTLGFEPTPAGTSTAAHQPVWHSLRIEVPDHADRVIHRAAYLATPGS
ncbi:MAG: VWA domain-containing protein [Candidatus Acidiferrales bacterium]